MHVPVCSWRWLFRAWFRASYILYIERERAAYGVSVMSARSKGFSRAVFASASTPPPLYEERTRPTPRPTVLSAGGAPCRRAGPTIHAKHLGEAAPRPSLRQIMHVGEERACECHGEAGVADVAPQPPEAWRSMEAGATEFESSRPAFRKPNFTQPLPPRILG